MRLEGKRFQLLPRGSLEKMRRLGRLGAMLSSLTEFRPQLFRAGLVDCVDELKSTTLGNGLVSHLEKAGPVR